MSYKIFVSYSTHDLKQVDSLRQQLEGTSVEIFIAEYSIAPSEDLKKSISKAISECDLFVVFWSKKAKESEWVTQEIGQASALNKTILPLVLTKGIKLPGFINHIKYLNIYEDPEASINDARKIVFDSYNKKIAIVEGKDRKKQKDKDALVLMGIGAFLLWAFNS